MKRFYLTSVIAVFINTFMYGNCNNNDTIFKKQVLNTYSWKFEPIVIFEGWSTFSMNEKSESIHYADRFNTHIRRFRFGAKGRILPWLKYSAMFHADGIGEDSFSSVNVKYKGIDVWNAYIIIRLLKNSDCIHIHTGYYWAAISREYNTSPWAISSFDKSYSVWYLRNFLTGKGNGIERGIGLGGLKNFSHFGISYRFSVHQIAKHASPEYSNPLFSGRCMFSIGDHEQKKYKYMLCGNQWGKRKGITLGFGAAYQDKVNNELTGKDSVFFDRSYAYGADILINYRCFTIDGEYFIMKRFTGDYAGYKGHEFHIRCSYLFHMLEQLFETSIMKSFYLGEGNSDLYKYTGNNLNYDIGVNWYIDKEKVKFCLHYVFREASLDTKTGDYFGTSVQLIL